MSNINFANVLTGAVPDALYSCPSDFNGFINSVDVVKPSTHIKDQYKISINDAYQFDLKASIASELLRNSSPNDDDVRAPAVESSMKRIGALMVMHVILSLVAKAGLTISYRSSDVYTYATENERFRTAEIATAYKEAANKIYAAIVASPSALSVAFEDSKHIILAIVANAMHRDMHEGHNWYTDYTNKSNTGTNRCIAVAGEGRLAFANFMVAHGHDIWHVLGDKCLASIASAIVGVDEKILPGNTTYNGVVYVDASLSSILKLPESATDRYPVGVMGKSAMIKGLEASVMMIDDITSKVRVPNVVAVTTAIYQVSQYIKNGSYERRELLNLRDVLAPILAASAGYCKSATGLAVTVAICDSLNALASKHTQYYAKGSILATRMRDVKADNAAVSSAIESVFGMMITSLESTAVPNLTSMTPVTDVSTANSTQEAIEFKVSETNRKLQVVSAAEKVQSVTDVAFDRLEVL